MGIVPWDSNYQTTKFDPRTTAMVSPAPHPNGVPPNPSPHSITQPYVALDCEMVGVGPGGKRSVLARVSVVDFVGNCLLDTYVRVQEKVTDYRTHITGIEPHHLLSPQAIPFAQCRNIVKDLTRNKILVGHGLNNDLKVLGLDHPWYCTRDTAFYKPYMRIDHYGRHSPRRLRDLAQSYLGIVIQQEGLSHNPIEDACAAMLLYRRAQSKVSTFSLLTALRCCALYFSQLALIETYSYVFFYL